MPIMRLEFESIGISDIGLKRENNEDAWAVIPQHQLCVLADGMGGHQAGEVAARVAVDTICASLRDFFPEPAPKTVETATRALHKSISQANHNVFFLSLSNSSLTGMGTTLCCTLLLEDNLIFSHVGDSRIYRFKHRLELLTQDHTLRNERGYDPDRPISKNILTRVVGTSAEIRPDTGLIKVMPEEIFFLCSDGLTDAVSHEEMENILLKSPSIRESAHKLVEKAKEKGGNDNITVVMIKIL